MPDAGLPLPAGNWIDIPERGRAWVWDTRPDATDRPTDSRAADSRAADSRVPDSRPAVVLLHGWTSTAALNWCRCFSPLGEVTRVVAMDHRGHGRGIRSSRPFSLEACSDDVAALVELLGLGPVVVAGYSMGGPVAQLVWRRHPEAVAGVILCATAMSFADGPAVPPLFLQTVGLGLSMAINAVPAGVRQEGIRLLTRGRGEPSAMAAWALAETGSGDPGAFVQAAASLATFDSRPWIADLDRPAAVVVTTHDRTVAPARQWALARTISGAAAFPVPADHRACVEDPEHFVPALLDAYRSVTGS